MAKQKLSRTCWASRLGGCDGKRSNEHVISKTVLRGQWKFKIPNGSYARAASLQVKNLCQKHNHVLSQVDDEAGRYFNGTHALLGVSGFEQDLPPNRILRVDGWKLERWFLKTFINMVSSKFGIADKDKPIVDSVSLPLVEYAFGVRHCPPSKPFGLWIVEPPEALQNHNYVNAQIKMAEVTIFRKKEGRWSERHQGPMHMKFQVTGNGMVHIANFNLAPGMSDEKRAEMGGDDYNFDMLVQDRHFRPVKFGWDVQAGRDMTDPSYRPENTVEFDWGNGPA